MKIDKIISYYRKYGLIKLVKKVLKYIFYKPINIIKRFIYSENIISLLENNKGINIYVSKNKLISQQFNNNFFNRYDIIVRLLAIENYYNENNYGFELYKKMQIKRNTYKTHNETRFINLIDSFKKEGLKNIPIKVDKNLKLIDGSHRIACIIYFNCNQIPIALLPIKQNVNYSLSWFKNNGFTTEEINKIEEKANKVIVKMGVL